MASSWTSIETYVAADFSRHGSLSQASPLAHEYTTGPEIIEDVIATPSTSSRPSSGKVDAFVAGAGTGGTITGTSRALKEHNTECVVVGIDPVRCSGTLLHFRPLTLRDIERKHPRLPRYPE